MTTPAQVGRNEYRAQIAQMRMTAQRMRGLLEQVMGLTQSAFLQGLLGRMALALVEFDECVTRLDEIGRNAKGE